MLSLLGKHGQTPSNYFKGGWGAGYLTLAMERRMWWTQEIDQNRPAVILHCPFVVWNKLAKL